MACQLFPNPPNTTPLVTISPGAHALAQAYLDTALATKLPLGSWEIDTLAGQPVVKFFCHHTICNAQPGCCPAVTLFRYTGPLVPTPTGPQPAPPLEGVVPPESIDWQIVGITAALAAGVVGAFWLALQHAGKPTGRNR